MALLLFLLGVALYVGWWFTLSFHSPLVPDAASAHTEALSMIGRSALKFYVTTFEAMVALLLLLLAFALPGFYLAWCASRRRPQDKHETERSRRAAAMQRRRHAASWRHLSRLLDALECADMGRPSPACRKSSRLSWRPGRLIF